jgi:ribulose-5-phosphate 4-epimerase/fuculose-1-phosphate aldolase
MIMHNHGLLAAGRTVAEAIYYLYILEAACKIQVDILSASSKPIIPDQDAIESLTKYTAVPAEDPHEYVNVTWDAMIRSLKSAGVQWIK